MFKDDEDFETRYCKNCLELQTKLETKERECKVFKRAFFKIEKKIKKICAVCPAKDNTKYCNNDCMVFGIKRIIRIVKDIM